MSGLRILDRRGSDLVFFLYRREPRERCPSVRKTHTLPAGILGRISKMSRDLSEVEVATHGELTQRQEDTLQGCRPEGLADR